MIMNPKIEAEARSFALQKHGAQKDDNGLPYTNHLKQVVEILKQVTTDHEILAAAWLHDTLEDTKTSYEELATIFGKEIADLVHEVTHDPRQANEPKRWPRLKTKKAILIKFADRLSNLSRMETWSEKRQYAYLLKSKFWNS